MLIDTTSYRSPNFDAGRAQPVSLLLLHATAGDLRSALAWLCNPASKASSHYVISKLGRAFQLVDESNVAWHAGRATWHGARDVNGISIGVELENANDGRDPYPQPQVDALTALARDILARHQLVPAQIARHLDVAVPAGRKTDPAGFPFAAWQAALHAHTYTVQGVPIYQRQDRVGPLAGYLASGDRVTIDATYPNGAGHLADGRGFVDMAALGSPT